MHIPPAFDCRFHHCEVGRPSTALVPVADFVFLEGVEDLVEAVVGGEQDLGLKLTLLYWEDNKVAIVVQRNYIWKCSPLYLFQNNSSIEFHPGLVAHSATTASGFMSASSMSCTCSWRP